ncbi:hypothetical protein BN2475_140073 [Paraburkholderia ribeironis]|uniref:Uncharacterized protein n=1 Tax=Paraburkholderia ribeironis TaxID=1247936 RepID=A0A1N7RT26_9BURK|nr:hypothetical protein BN2475_140073 [Paraburkholderia ribeironis]
MRFCPEADAVYAGPSNLKTAQGHGLPFVQGFPRAGMKAAQQYPARTTRYSRCVTRRNKIPAAQAIVVARPDRAITCSPMELHNGCDS